MSAGGSRPASQARPATGAVRGRQAAPARQTAEQRQGAVPRQSPSKQAPRQAPTRQAPRQAATMQGAAARPAPGTRGAAQPRQGAQPPRASTRATGRRATTSAPPAAARTRAPRTAVSRSAAPVERRRAPRPPRPTTRAANPVKRQRWLILVAALVVVVFVGRLVQLQVFEAASLAADARRGRTAVVNLPAPRGDIVDRNGVVLATSEDRYTITADPVAIQSFSGRGRTDAEGNPVADGALGVAQLLAPILGQDRQELAAQINGDTRSVLLARNVEPAKQRAIRDLRLSAWIRTELVPMRTYPRQNVAGPLLGFVDADGVGQGGLERAFEDLLAGTPGRETFERSRDGVRIPGGHSTSVPALAGGDLQLTIDAEVQRRTQASLDDVVGRFGAEFGIAVVEDLRTGELLAVADSGSVDPNDRSNADVARGSRAVQDIFDPGSTSKVITMAAALETGAWTPESQFTVPYQFTTPNGQTFHDSHQHPTWNLTLAGVLARSSNTGTVQIAEQIPAQVQYDFMRKFGFGQFTGLDLPGESRGILHPADQWDGRTRYAVTFGQGVSVNAMQAMDVFATVGNGGVSKPPVLVKGTRVPGTDTFAPTERAEGERVISEENADTLLRMMEEVTGDEGTATGAQIPGYRIAGKTGTAQIIMPNRGTTYMASFIGVAPADDPRYAVGVFIKTNKVAFGGTVAVPVFRDVMSFVLQREGVPPSAPAPEPIPLTW